MNPHLKPLWMATALVCSSALFSAPALALTPSPSSAQASMAAEVAAPQDVSGVAKKPQKRKAGRKGSKAYSKATLSAFAPYAAPAAPAALPLAAPATVSAVVIAPQGDGLRESLPAPLPEASTSSALGLQMQPKGLLASDPTESKPVTLDEAVATDEATVTPAAAADATTLGQEELSVIDRTRDKPKAQPIASGPLRVRVKDSGVRASVQIPLEVLSNN